MTDEAARIADSLSEAQRRVIAVLGHYDSECGYTNFQHTANRCGMTRDEVAPILRELREIGLAEYASGLATDAGAFYGSGYAMSDLGGLVMDELESIDVRAHLMKEKP